MATEQMTLRATLQGHGGWVTQIATTPQYPDMILSASRGAYILLNFMYAPADIVLHDCSSC